MKKVLTLLTLIVCFGLFPVYSQEETSNQKTLAKLMITDGTKNGQDIAPVLIDQKAFLVVYENITTKELLLANFWPKNNSQSFGSIYSLETKHDEESSENYESDLFLFQWRYINTYDDKKGTAKVELLKVYKPQGVYFKMTIIPENLDVLIYKGYVDGSLNLTVYE